VKVLFLNIHLNICISGFNIFLRIFKYIKILSTIIFYQITNSIYISCILAIYHNLSTQDINFDNKIATKYLPIVITSSQTRTKSLLKIGKLYT